MPPDKVGRANRQVVSRHQKRGMTVYLKKVDQGALSEINRLDDLVMNQPICRREKAGPSNGSAFFY